MKPMRDKCQLIVQHVEELRYISSHTACPWDCEKYPNMSAAWSAGLADESIFMVSPWTSDRSKDLGSLVKLWKNLRLAGNLTSKIKFSQEHTCPTPFSLQMCLGLCPSKDITHFSWLRSWTGCLAGDGIQHSPKSDPRIHELLGDSTNACLAGHSSPSPRLSCEEQGLGHAQQCVDPVSPRPGKEFSKIKLSREHLSLFLASRSSPSSRLRHQCQDNINPVMVGPAGAYKGKKGSQRI